MVAINKITPVHIGGSNPMKTEGRLYTLWTKFLVFTVFIFMLLLHFLNTSYPSAARVRSTTLCPKIAL
jgi:hypothetical protein